MEKKCIVCGNDNPRPRAKFCCKACEQNIIIKKAKKNVKNTKKNIIKNINKNTLIERMIGKKKTEKDGMNFKENTEGL